jgi:hypothetical protein
MASAAALTMACGPAFAQKAVPVQTAAAETGQEVPQPGSAQYFGDWAVGCDNVLRCQAMALEPKDAGGGRALMLEIIRPGGPAGEVTLRVRSLDTLPPRLMLVVNGRKIVTLKAEKGGDDLVAGAGALSAVKAMASAVTVELVTKKGEVLSVPSIAGLAESLRFIDSRQGRTGTRSALVAPGNQPDSRVPAPPPLPVVGHPPAPDADSAPPLTDAELAAARKLAQCDASLGAVTVTELVPLDRDDALLLLPCEAGAYNVSAVPLVARGSVAGRRTLSMARFDFAPGFTGDPGAPPLVVNALWDARRGILSSLAKGRGVGDCGASEDYVWDGAMFRLIERHAMHVCRGAWEWIRLWTASPHMVAPSDQRDAPGTHLMSPPLATFTTRPSTKSRSDRRLR